MDITTLLLFCVGLGALSYSLAFNQYHKNNEALMKVIIIISIMVCVLLIIVQLFVLSICMIIGAFISHLFLKNNKKESKKIITKPIIKKYVNHCWNCKTNVNSDYDKLCFKCRRHYVCSSCSKCWCDAPDEIKYRSSFKR